MSKVWQVENQKKLHTLVEEFCNGNDVALDQELLPYDLEGSLAHAKMLKEIGILSGRELVLIQQGLEEILKLYKKGAFVLQKQDEDCHSAIENKLVEIIGKVGEKIHTARSRNDQVLVALRLYSKEKLLEVVGIVEELIGVLFEFGNKYSQLPMPGHTHMQKAMPSSVSLWIKSFAWTLKDDLALLKSAYKYVDQNPLGSGAAFGVSLPVDRHLTTKLLGFAKTQQNVLSAANSRGKSELVVLQSLSQVMVTLSKLAQDVLLYTTSEFGFFEVSGDLTTGSSIMPQKKNLDVMELVRAKAQVVLSLSTQVAGICAGLPSGYNRDLQETKEPLMKGLKITCESLKICSLMVGGLRPNSAKLKAAMTEEIYATDKAYILVKQGVPFREAYKIIKSLEEGGEYHVPTKSRECSIDRIGIK